MRGHRVLVCALAAALAGAAHGAEDAAEQEFLREVPTVLTASRLLQPVSDAPVAVTVIDRATIEATGVRNITDLFRLVPGMYVRPGIGIEGIVPVVSYHGLTNEFARRMQVLIDGRSVYLPPFSTVLWDDLPLAIDDIDHIEVVRGPNAASYGANAYFGTINIVTRTPIGGEGAYARARLGSNGVRDVVLRHTDAQGPVDYRISAGHRADDGYPEQIDRQHHDFLTGEADLVLNNRDSLQAQIGYGAGLRQLGGTTDPVNRPRAKKVEDGHLQLRWQRAIAPHDELSFQYFYEQHSATESDHTLPLDLPGQGVQSYTLRADYRFDRHDVELVRTLEPRAELRLVLGAGARVDEIKAPIYFDGRPYLSSNLQRLFVHIEWRTTSALLLQAGGMLEHTSISGVDFSPRICATYHLSDDQSLRFSVSHATRTPSLFEAQGAFVLHFGSLADPIQQSGGQLQPEHIVSSAVGYHASALGGQFQTDLKVYRDHASHMIEETADPNAPYVFQPLTVLRNLNDARVRGAELEIHYQPSAQTRYLLAYANTTIDNSDPSQGRTMPRNLLSLLAEQRLGENWTAGAALYLNGRLPALTGVYGQLNDAALGYQGRIDAHLSRSFYTMGRKARLTFGVENLGSGFVEFRQATTFDRRGFIEGSIGL